MKLKAKRKSKDAVIGLDLGASVVKALEMTRVGSRLTITNCALGGVAGADGYGAAIAAVIEAGNFVAGRVAVGMAGRGTVVRRIALPAGADAGKAAAEAAAKALAYPVRDAVVDYDAREASVVFAAAKRDDVADKRALLDAAGLVPDVVDMELAAMANALETVCPTPGTPWCLADFGATKTLIAVSDGNDHLFQEFPVGGDKLTEMVAHRLGMDFDEAEAVKQDPDALLDIVTDAIYPGLEDLAAEIRMCRERFQRSAGGRAVAGTYLSGGLAAFPGLVPLMGRLAGTPTALFDPFEKLKTVDMDAAFLDANRHRFAVAFGLACQARE